MNKPTKPKPTALSRQEIMAEKRAAALRENLKKRKEQNAARTEQEIQSKI